MKRIFLCFSLAIINCYASTVIHRSKFAQARVGLAPPPPEEMIEPPMPTWEDDEDLIPPGIDGGYNPDTLIPNMPEEIGTSIYSQPPEAWECK